MFISTLGIEILFPLIAGSVTFDCWSERGVVGESDMRNKPIPKKRMASIIVSISKIFSKPRLVL